LGFPVRGSPRAGGKYDVRIAGAFKCAFVVYTGEEESLEELWADFLSRLAAAGHVLTDERRVILQVGRDVEAGSVRLELQVGVK